MANRCFLCHKSEETIDHLLIHCEKTREVWMVFLSFFGVSWVFPRSVKETLLGWRGSFVGKKRKVTWQLGLLCLFWVIWKARNSIAFEDCEPSIQRLKASFVVGIQIVDKRWSFDLNRFYRLRFLVVGKALLWGEKERKCGSPSRFSFFGQFGRRGIGSPLKGVC